MAVNTPELPVSGRRIWLEFVPENYVEKKHVSFPNVEAGTLTIEAVTVGDGSFRAEAFYEGRRCGQAETTTAGGNVVVTLPLSEVHLWEAGAGRLYDLTITFGGRYCSQLFRAAQCHNFRGKGAD
mgnify:CR=1 FL=1